MKKANLKSIEKARKALRASLEEGLSDRIKESITNLGYDPKKVKKEISKASVLLAKRIAEKVKIKKNDLSSMMINADISGKSEEISESGEMLSNDNPAVSEWVRASGKKLIKVSSKASKLDLEDGETAVVTGAIEPELQMGVS